MSALAREHVKVVLTGEGSDELFAGLRQSIPRALVNWRAGAVYGARPAPDARWVADTLVPNVPGTLGRYARRSFLGMPRTPEAMFFDNFAVIGLRRQRRSSPRASPTCQRRIARTGLPASSSTRPTGAVRRSTACCTRT